MYDFHMHTTFSDGSRKPREMFEKFREVGIKAASITDHDTSLGLNEIHDLSREFNIPYIPALELTVKEQGIKLHVLAYGINRNSHELKVYSNKLKEYMDGKSMAQIKKLRELGLIDILAEEFFEEAKGGPLYRAKLLKTLSNHGYFKQEEIMANLGKYFGKDGYCYMEDEFPYMNFKEGCKFIKDNGGQAVLAHPNKIRKKSEDLYKNLINSPLLDGLEVFHPSITEETKIELLDIIEKKNLMCTGGTDCHGIFMKNPREVGSLEIPEIVIKSLEKYII